MKNLNLRSPLLVSLIVVVAFAAAWLPVSMVRAGRLAQDGLVSDEIPQDPPADELRVGPLSTYNGVRLAEPDEPVNIMIELEDQPAVAAFAKEQPDIPVLRKQTWPQAVAAAKAQITRIERAQQKLVDELSGARFNARVLSRVQRVYNGVAVEVAAGKLGEIHTLPGVKAVHVVRPLYKMLDTSVPFIGSAQVWSSGNTGKDIIVAVIDDGVDYVHTSFRGSGSQTHYANNNPAIIGDVPFPTVKVIGGFDFVGDNFDAASSDPARRTPQPDPDPFACDDHGTKVAGAVAGSGVNANGTTYPGPYNLSTPFSALKIGPGVAPEAVLIALKVFGCSGATRGDLVVQAIDRALDPNGDGNFADRADVINMSLGSPFFPLAGSPELTAIDRAAQAGIYAIVAAGNNGDTYYSINGLGVTPNALSVAASLDDGIFFQNVQVNSPPGIAGQYPAAVAEFGPALGSSGFNGSVILASPADGCVAFSNASQINGNIAFIDRGTCPLVTKVRNAQNAGAVAAIVANNTATLPLNMGDDGTGRDVRIPSYLIDQPGGDLIRSELQALNVQALNAVNVSLLPGNIVRQSGRATSFLSSSSRGGFFGNAVKPDITAPGANITSSYFGSGNGAAFITGTSMSTPHMAGVAALLLDKYPNATFQEVKARVYSTGTDVFSGPNNGLPKYGATSAGAGTVSAVNAAATDLYVAYGPSTAPFIFGDVKEVTSNETVPITVSITNNGNSAQTYTVTYDRTSDIPGVDPSFPPTVSVPGNSSTDYQINWGFIPANMKHTRDATVGATQGGNPRHWLSEEIGYFNFTPSGGGLKLRLPAYFAARPASNMGTSQSSINLATATGTQPLNLTGQGVDTGPNRPTDEVSLASPFEWTETSPDDSLTPPTLNHFDLQHIGLRTNFPAAGGITNTRLLFGVSTFGNWLSPNQVTFNVFIDTDQNGTDDFHLFNTSLPNAQGGPSDVFVTRLFNIANGMTTTQFFANSFSAAQFNTVLFNTNVLILPVAASALGLTDADGKFDYQVKTSIGNVVVDQSRRHTYDVTKPGLEFGASTIFFDLNGGTIPVGHNLANFQAAGSEGALIFHHHNKSGNRAQILPANLGFEGDVQPRPGGNGSVTIADWVQNGRFVAGLDTVNLGSEFQRADVAPRSTGGNGQLTVSDWVQAGRYAAGLDPVPSSSGPVIPSSSLPFAPPGPPENFTERLEADFSPTRLIRNLHPDGLAAIRNRQVSYLIEVEAQGVENALGFSLSFDPLALRDPRIRLSGNLTGAVLQINNRFSAQGRFGVAFVLPPGQTLPAGKRQLAIVTFTPVESKGAHASAIEFGDHPVLREAANAEADSLPVTTLRLTLNAERRLLIR